MRFRKFYAITILGVLLPTMALPAYATEETPAASPTIKLSEGSQDTQTLVVSSLVAAPTISRDNYSATSKEELDRIAAEQERARLEQERKVKLASLPKITPDPGSAQAYAHDQVLSRGWSEEDFSCLVSLWSRESGWRVNAANASSGAYGIPQALPGSKMASAGSDWETNPETQIRWGLGYISSRYSTPCGAWGHSQASGWY